MSRTVWQIFEQRTGWKDLGAYSILFGGKNRHQYIDQNGMEHVIDERTAEEMVYWRYGNVRVAAFGLTLTVFWALIFFVFYVISSLFRWWPG